MTRKKLGVGFVGGGWVSLNRHMPAAKAQAELDLIGLVTGEPRLENLDRARLGQAFGLKHFTADLSERWLREDVDVVVIGTPPDTHYDLVMRCLGMGKHVLVEKPFSLTTAHAEEMVQAARDAGRKLGVVHNFQFADASRRALALCESGTLGELRGVYGFQSSNQRRRLPSWYPELPMGLFTDESPHLLYLLSSFVKNTAPLSVHVGPRMAVDDNTPRYVSAQFEGDRPASLQMIFDGALSEWHLVLMGDKRTVLVDLFRDILAEIPDDGRHESLDVARSSWSGLRSHIAGFVASGWRHLSGRMDYGNHEVFRRFVAAVVDGSPMPGIEAEDGRAVVAIMEQILSASEAPARKRLPAQKA